MRKFETFTFTNRKTATKSATLRSSATLNRLPLNFHIKPNLFSFILHFRMKWEFTLGVLVVARFRSEQFSIRTLNEWCALHRRIDCDLAFYCICFIRVELTPSGQQISGWSENTAKCIKLYYVIIEQMRGRRERKIQVFHDLPESGLHRESNHFFQVCFHSSAVDVANVLTACSTNFHCNARFERADTVTSKAEVMACFSWVEITALIKQKYSFAFRFNCDCFRSTISQV